MAERSEAKSAKRSFASKYYWFLFLTRSFASRLLLRFAQPFIVTFKWTINWSLSPQGLSWRVLNDQLLFFRRSYVTKYLRILDFLLWQLNFQVRKVESIKSRRTHTYIFAFKSREMFLLFFIFLNFSFAIDCFSCVYVETGNFTFGDENCAFGESDVRLFWKFLFSKN